MLQNFNFVIADTTCFILLEKIGELELLKSVFGSIITTPAIAFEFGSQLPDWVEIKEVTNTDLQRTLQLEVDAGEASAIALSIELVNSFLILDDLEARTLAKQLNLNYTGTLGLVLRAKRSGHIPSVKAIVEKIQATNFRVSSKLYSDILYQANEL